MYGVFTTAEYIVIFNRIKKDKRNLITKPNNKGG